MTDAPPTAKTSPSAIPSEHGLRLIAILMQRFGEHGDAVDALRWALPNVLEALGAEAGSLFLFREEDAMLECMVCMGPVDITGLLVPADRGLIGRAFATGKAEIVSNASTDEAHYRQADTQSGFRTVTTATAPVHLGTERYGAIQAINRRAPDDPETILLFQETDLHLLLSLASALAMAISISNMRLAEKVISDQILRRDIDQATEVQAALMPLLDPAGRVAGKVLPARQLSGDFVNFLEVESRLVFCQGDVAGKGITAALMMAQAVSLLRVLARQGQDILTIARSLNDELLRIASDQFITFVLGSVDLKTGAADLINCGHGPVLLRDDATGDVQTIHSHSVPLGLVDLAEETLEPWRGNLGHAALYIATDGVMEATMDGAEIGLDWLIRMMEDHQGLRGVDRMASIMGRFTRGDISTHDDASLLVVTCIGQEPFS